MMNKILTLIAVCIIEVSAHAAESITTGGRTNLNVRDSALSILVSTNSSARDAQKAIKELKGYYIVPEIFMRVANNSSYHADTRRACIQEFFRRHVPTETRLFEFRSFIEKCKWLRRQDIKSASAVTGMLPIQHHIDDSVFYIDLLSHLPGRSSTIYFRVIGRIDVDTVTEQLLGVGSIQSVEKLRVGIVGSDLE